MKNYFSCFQKHDLVLIPVLFLSFFGLLGWKTGNLILSSFSESYIPMAPSTAWFFIVLCASIFIIQCQFVNKLIKKIAVCFLSIIAIFSTLLIINYFSEFSFDAEDIFLKNPDTFHKVLLGRMSPLTALLFLIISTCSVIFYFHKPGILQNVFGVMSLLIFFLSIVILIGYIYNAPLLYSMNVIPVAFSTSLAFTCISIKLLFISEFRFWPFSLFPDTHVTKLLLRGFLPPVLLLLFFYGLIDSRSEISDNPLIESAFLIISLFVTCVIIFVISKKIGKIINAHEDELRKKNDEITTQNEEYQSLNEELNESNFQIRKINEELQNALEKAEESEKLKSVFLANLSHEIRTPMNAIKGFTDLLSNRDLPIDKQVLFSRIIMQRSDDLIKIINDILDISKIEAGQLKIKNSPCNINTLLEELYEFFNNRNIFVEKKKIELKLNNKLTTYNANIYVDIFRLKQILINLINNAFKFTEKGIVEFGCTVVENIYLQFFVRDTGIGISKEKQLIIFDRFRQADENYLSNKYGGIGLGLSISKGLTELMKGKMWLESEQDRGTTFYFTIPYIPFIHDIIKDEILTELTQINWTGKKILIVEDDKDSSTFISEILTEFNASCLFADSGNKTLEIYENEKNIDLILMDIRLPDNDGFELTRKIMKLNPVTKIIAQTAYASETDKLNSLDAGCIDFISKPLDKKLFVTIINKHLT